MPMTYVEVVRQLQQRSIDTLKVAQDAQLLTLRAARDSTLSGPALPVARDVTDWALALSYRLMAQQASYAKRFVDSFAQRSKAGARPTPQAVLGAGSTTSHTVESAVATVALETSAAPAHMELSAAPHVDPLAAPAANVHLSSAPPSANLLAEPAKVDPPATSPNLDPSATPPTVDLLTAPANAKLPAVPALVELVAAPADVDPSTALTPAETLNATSTGDSLHATAETSGATPAVETLESAADLANSQILTPPFAEPGSRELVDERFVPMVSSDDDFVLKVSTKSHDLGDTADQDMRPVKKRAKVPAVSTNSMPPKRTPKKPPKASR